MLNCIHGKQTHPSNAVRGGGASNLLRQRWFAEQDRPNAKRSSVGCRRPDSMYLRKISDCLHEVAYFILKLTYRFKILIRATANAVLPVTSLLDSDASPSILKNDFLPLAWKKSVTLIKWPQLRSASGGAVHKEGIVVLLICTGDPRNCAWFEIVENLALYVLLDTSFIECYIRALIPNGRKVVPSHSKPTASFLARMAINLININDTVFNRNINLPNDASCDKSILYRIAHPSSIPAPAQGAVSVSCQEGGIITIETHYNIVHRLCTMNAQCLMDIYLESHFMSTLQLWQEIRLICRGAWKSLPRQMYQHASHMQELISGSCWKWRVGLQHKVRSSYPILQIMEFPVSRLSASPMKWIAKMQYRNQTEFWIPTVAEI